MLIIGEAMNIVITGGAGFIGSHIAYELMRKKNNILILDNLYSGKISNLSNIFNKLNYFNIDISYRSDKLIDIFNNYRPELLFHLAAIPGTNYSVINPLESNKANVDGTINILELSAKYNVKRVIFSSSSSIYGDTDVIPTSECASVNPKSPYALQKKIGEDYCRLFSEIYNLDTVCLRYFNIMGPRQYGNSPYSSVVSLFAESIKNNTNPIIYGDGEQTRDFCSVENVVKANILAAEHPQSFKGDIFNIGSGQAVSINKLHSLMDAKEAIYKPARLGDVRHSVADITKAKNILGYNPDITFEDGLKNTLDWYLST